MDPRDPGPQIPTSSRIELIKPASLSQAFLHFRPGLHTRGSDPPSQSLSEPLLFFYVEGEDTAHENGPCDGARLRMAADTDRTVGFALFDEVHELCFETSDDGTGGQVHVDGN